MSSFATLSDVTTLSGRTLTTAETTRVEALLPLVSDALRYEASKVGKSLDGMIADSEWLESEAKLVTVDIVTRVLRQNAEGEPMTQESQSALGYTWSGTYAIPGGGIAGAIMRNDLKRLGLKRQQRRVIDLWEDSEE